MEASIDYDDPPWAATPPEGCQWHLLEIKDGVEVANHALHHRPCTVLGRAVDMVHVPIHHASASRQHARIAFDGKTGQPWLRDLKSTHGTKCNKRQLPPQTVGKTESMSLSPGARGVMIYPGDVLQFGASTRIFCLEGPPSYERGAIRKTNSSASTASVPTSQQRQGTATESQSATQDPVVEDPDENDVEVSWGIDMSEPSSSEPDTDIHVPMQAQVPEKHRKALERLNELKYKLANIKAEDERIRRKGELSEGQEHQLQRNLQREEELEEKIATREADLYYKLHPEENVKRANGNGRRKSDLGADIDDDDSDFFDRTKQNENDIANESATMDSAGESEQSLIVKWTRLSEQQREITGKLLAEADRKVRDAEMRLAALKEADDEDSFFAQNDLNIAKENVEKIAKRHQALALAMDEIESVLRVVNSKLIIDRKTGYIGTHPPPPKAVISATEKMMPPPVKKTVGPAAPIMPPPPLPTQGAFFSMPPPPSIVKNHPLNTNDRSSSFVMPPPPKKKRVTGPNILPPPILGPNILPPPRQDMRTERTTDMKNNSSNQSMGTLAMLNAMQSSNKLPKSRPATISSGPNSGKEASGLILDDSKEDRWVAPKGQDGSGVTKLNAKFAGRY